MSSVINDECIGVDPWSMINAYCLSTDDYSKSQNIPVIIASGEAEARFAAGADIVEHPLKSQKIRLLSRDGVNIYSASHAYGTFNLLSYSDAIRKYESARLFAEYGSRFIACHALSGEYIRIVAMTDRMEYTYADQIIGEKGGHIKQLFDVVTANKGYNRGFKSGIPYYNNGSHIMLFYVDAEAKMLRFLVNESVPDMLYDDLDIYRAKKDGTVLNLPAFACNIIFSAIASTGSVFRYFRSEEPVRPDEKCIEVIRYVVNKFSSVVGIMIDDQLHKDMCTFVGYRFPCLSDVPMSNDDNGRIMFSELSPLYLPDVRSLGWDALSKDSCHMVSMVHYLACTHYDRDELESNIENGVYASYSDRDWAKLAHRSFIICEAQLEAEKYVYRRARKYFKHCDIDKELDNDANITVNDVRGTVSKISPIDDYRNALKKDDDVDTFIKGNPIINISHDVFMMRALKAGSQLVSEYDTRAKVISDIDRQWIEFYKTLSDVDYNDMCEFVKARVRGHDAAIDKACYHVWSYFKALVSKEPPKRDNFIIAGGSGCGKTEFMRAIKAYLDSLFTSTSIINVPVRKIDASCITMAGYKGLDLEELLYNNLYLPSLGTGIGIIFLDELDKKLLPQHDSSGENTNAAVQDNLLTAVEGSDVSVEGYHTGIATVDTRYTLFVGLGTFDYIRSRHEDVAKSAIGFTSDQFDCDAVYWQDITEQDIIEQGGKDEFLGRFSSLINFSPLSDDSLLDILRLHIDEKKEYVYKTTKSCLTVDDDVARKFIKFARNRRGVREMFRIFDGVLHKGVIDMLKSGNSLDELKVLSIEDEEHYMIKAAVSDIRNLFNIVELDDVSEIDISRDSAHDIRHMFSSHK